MPCSVVFIVNFEQANAGSGVHIKLGNIKPIKTATGENVLFTPTSTSKQCLIRNLDDWNCSSHFRPVSF